ncbi:response regulator transcription factor [Pseudoclavibacter terrae]
MYDQAASRAGMRGSLEDLGFEVVGEAKNRRAGLELVRQLRPDLVLLDLLMPVMSGLTSVRGAPADSIRAVMKVLLPTHL